MVCYWYGGLALLLMLLLCYVTGMCVSVAIAVVTVGIVTVSDVLWY